MIERYMIHLNFLQLINKIIIMETKRKEIFCKKCRSTIFFFQSYSNVEYQTLENSSIKKFNEFIILQFEMLAIGRTIITL